MDRLQSPTTPFAHRAFAVLGALVCVLQVGIGHAQVVDERWAGSGTIAGQTATFILDTGAQQAFVIAAADSKRFGLEADRENPPEAPLFEAFSKPVEVLPPGGQAQPVTFAILRETGAPGLGMDAIVGWPVLKAYVTHYDRQRGILAIGPDVEPRLANAQSLPIIPSDYLVFDVGTDESPLPVLLDSGDSGGVMLSQPLWNAWRRDNPDLPHTYAWRYWLDTGWVVLERVLARELRLGQLTLRNVLVSPAPEGTTDTVAVVGLTAFANHAVVIDGPGGSIHVGGPGRSLVLPGYNRLGASFGPDNRARVAENSPAAHADIRDGDLLIGINGQTPDAYADTVRGHVWEQPAGTAVQLTLRRESETIERRVTLRDFLTSDH
jgi:hypothetical protein